MDQIRNAAPEQKLPRWNELPDLELYMDQVIALVRRYLDGYPSVGGKSLTPAMVNNYVKQGVLPAPKGKKYTKQHLAHLLAICILKASLPIASIRQVIARELEQNTEAETYDCFCDLLEEAGRNAAQALAAEADPMTALYRAALRAQAEQATAWNLCGELFPEKPEKK